MNGHHSAETGDRARVSFLVGGVQKGGTTALDDWLRQQPDVRMATCKETHFFDTDGNFSRGTPDFDLYHAYFDRQPAAAVGESTPAYCYWLPAAERVAKYNPRMKWILLLRDPVDRAYSHWNMMRERGDENLPFIRALAAEPERLSRAMDPLAWRRYSYLDRGRYSTQVKRLWRQFGAEQVLVLRSEELWRDPARGLSQLCQFLEISTPEKLSIGVSRPGRYASPVTTGERKFVQMELEDSNHELADLLRWDLSEWTR